MAQMNGRFFGKAATRHHPYVPKRVGLWHKKIHPVELAARAHYRFEKIHPFGDGNGRIGRLIINYILWYNGYPMIIIENKRRRQYYKALQKDEEGFLNYFLRRYLTVHKKRYAT